MFKKLTAGIIAFALLQNDVKAQGFRTSKVMPSLKGSFNLSSFTADIGPFDKSFQGNFGNSSRYDRYFRVTGAVGVSAAYAFTKSFAIGTEIQYAGRGAAYRAPDGSVVTITNQGAEKEYDYYKYKIDYVEIPVTARFLLNTEAKGSMNVIFYTGIAPGFVASKKLSFDYYATNGSSITPTRKTDEQPLNDVTAFNLSPLIGIEVGGNEKAKSKFFLDLRLSLAALPVFTKSTWGAGANMRTGMWTTGLGFGIHFF